MRHLEPSDYDTRPDVDPEPYDGPTDPDTAHALYLARLDRIEANRPNVDPLDIGRLHDPITGEIHRPQRDHDWLTIRECTECGRVFDMLNSDDAAEWAYGHDCEA